MEHDRHVDDEAVTRAAASGTDAPDLSAEQRSHLAGCADCGNRVRAQARIATVLRTQEHQEPPPAVPSFDALIAPRLAQRAVPEPEPRPEPVPAPRVGPARAARLAAAVTLRQARLVPAALASAVVAGFAVLALALLLLPVVPAAPYVEAVTVGLVTVAGLVASDPGRDPGKEALHAVLVPPLAVWCARLVLVLGTVLALGAGVSALAGALPGAGAFPDLVGSWFPPALLGAALTVFGTVWRSPAVGLVLGGVSWAVAVVVLRWGPAESPVTAVAAPLWSDLAAASAVAALALAGAAWLVARPGRSAG
ncbi:hypothetical protein IDM40_08075 [Nocardiopsis sp. HNM0947]|uniref:Zinc-finger domain-containing protein n=1 Tax=Nocardiopsis coralli TaxID=2772213 RepID=A0ABR9P486_9ACTN|nr:hypothetical protein [Nocardiopsis coralli]MBE2998659.1 hypothetical protein [Nocardiopsis coralli]